MIKPKKSVENMSAYATPLFEDEYEFKLDGNENSFGPSPKVLECIAAIKDTSIKFYPIYGELLKKLSEFNKLPMDYFICTNGADEAIATIFTTYLDKGDKVLTVEPSFAMPKLYAQIVDAKYIEIPYTEKWKFPTDDFMAAIDDNPDLKLIHLTTPNNPTGDYIERDTIIKIIEKARDKVVVIDETYSNYCGIFNTDLAEKYDNVLITRSFSKDFALAGLRIGYIISNPENIAQLTKVRSPYSTNAIAMCAAIAALDDVNYFSKICAEIKENKKELETFLAEQGFTVYQTATNFALVDFGEKCEFIYREFLKNSIKVKKFNDDKFLKNTCRIAIPTKAGIKRIKDTITKLKRCALVFDMDGVIMDVRESYRVAIKETYKFFSGKEVSGEEIQAVKNRGGMNNDWDLTEVLLKESGFNIAMKDIIDKFQEIYWDNGNGLIRAEKVLLDKDLFKKLAERHTLAIFTGRLRDEAQFTLDYHGLSEFFYPVITTDDLDVARVKPCPDGVELVKNKIFYDKIFYFGDTTDDILCAVSAGVPAVGVLPPQDKSEALKQKMTEKGACAIINNINELEKVLECDYAQKLSG